MTNDLLLLHDSNVAEFSKEKLMEWELTQSKFTERFSRYLSKNPGVRRHDVIPLDNPEDGLSALRNACKSGLGGRLYRLLD